MIDFYSNPSGLDARGVADGVGKVAARTGPGVPITVKATCTNCGTTFDTDGKCVCASTARRDAKRVTRTG